VARASLSSGSGSSRLYARRTSEMASMVEGIREAAATSTTTTLSEVQRCISVVGKRRGLSLPVSIHHAAYMEIPMRVPYHYPSIPLPPTPLLAYGHTPRCVYALSPLRAAQQPVCSHAHCMNMDMKLLAYAIGLTFGCGCKRPLPPGARQIYHARARRRGMYFNPHAPRTRL
jgi:hypothetical protein